MGGYTLIFDGERRTYDFVQSEGPKSVERLAAMLASNGYTTIVIVGGDAALNRALNGVLSQGEEVRRSVAFGGYS